MASSDGTDSRTNSLATRSTASTHNDEDVGPSEHKGWLMKRTRMSRKWKRQWFLLKNTDLYYAKGPEDKLKRIPLTNSEISETSIDRKSFAFSIKSKENGRTYFIHAENEMTQNDWMQAICFAKAAGQREDNSSACVIQ
ncbi:hypothetical protein CHS0354_013296 [Potamilus streckersoni]|uniref:PH domain-containing protein n=1 Tax=Potamilus streckersoni TaxID=2493646 RepID=A0AAE0W491_9BIVA|nr:hypothetical protein CHS0354_013296 [Potamilus streckersoni]